MAEKTYYDILEIEPSAETVRMHESYKRMASGYRQSETNLSAFIYKMKDLNEAYLVLSDPEKRAEYDETIEYADSSVGSPEDEDSEQEVPVEIDQDSADEHKLRVESCSAFLSERGRVEVLGEVITTDGKAVGQFLEVQCNVYDRNGKLIGTNELLGKKAGRRLAVKWMVFLQPASAIPVKARIYFTE